MKSNERNWKKAKKHGKTHAFRTRCRMVLLKSEKRTSVEVARFLGGCEVVVNNWLKRYLQEGIKGLKTRASRGRPWILSQRDPVKTSRTGKKFHRDFANLLIY